MIIYFISDVYKLLRKKKFEQFDKMIQSIPHLINSLRDDDDDDGTLLMRVVRYGGDDDDVFDHLLDIPQDFNVRDGYGWNIIHFIALFGDDDRSVRRLIKLSKKTDVGSLINKQNVNGYTPLHVAAWKNKHQTIKQLLNFGCDVTLRNKYDELPEEHSRCDEVTKELIRKARQW